MDLPDAADSDTVKVQKPPDSVTSSTLIVGAASSSVMVPLEEVTPPITSRMVSSASSSVSVVVGTVTVNAVTVESTVMFEPDTVTEPEPPVTAHMPVVNVLV